MKHNKFSFTEISKIIPNDDPNKVIRSMIVRAKIEYPMDEYKSRMAVAAGEKSPLAFTVDAFTKDFKEIIQDIDPNRLKPTMKAESVFKSALRLSGIAPVIMLIAAIMKKRNKKPVKGK